MTGLRITHIGGPTALIEIDGWRLLTDPTFDAPGRRYAFGWGSASRKLSAQPPARGRRGRLRARLGGTANGVLWISGDTVLYDAD